MTINSFALRDLVAFEDLKQIVALCKAAEGALADIVIEEIVNPNLQKMRAVVGSELSERDLAELLIQAAYSVARAYMRFQATAHDAHADPKQSRDRLSKQSEQLMKMSGNTPEGKPN